VVTTRSGKVYAVLIDLHNRLDHTAPNLSQGKFARFLKANGRAHPGRFFIFREGFDRLGPLTNTPSKGIQMTVVNARWLRDWIEAVEKWGQNEPKFADLMKSKKFRLIRANFINRLIRTQREMKKKRA
jgi:hypothetical protein